MAVDDESDKESRGLLVALTRLGRLGEGLGDPSCLSFHALSCLHDGLGDWNRENTADFIDAALTRVSGAVDPDLKSLEIRIGIVDREATHLAIGAG